MQLYVLDNNFTRLGLIDSYECLVWERNYYTVGTFSMEIIADMELFQLLQKGNILLKNDDTKEAMYIDHRELKENDEGVEVLLVSGYSLSNWLNSRITLLKELQKGNAETVIRNYVESNCISPEESNRKLPNVFQGNNNNLGQQVDINSHYKPLLEEIEGIVKANELGFKIDLDLYEKKYIFEVFKGLDRTVNQSLNSKAIFSTQFDNVSNQNYIDSDNNYKNTVLVAGAGEDANRKTLLINNDNIGFDRLELFVDARDISDTKTVNEEEVPIPLDEYNKLLEARGIEKLAEHEKVETFDCTISDNETLVYRENFDLGDKVSIVNQKWGLLLHERIVSITETYDIEGLKIEMKIGNNIPTLIQKIKNKMR